MPKQTKQDLLPMPPVGTPVQWQSAFEQLSGVASAFSRLPEVTSTCEHGNVRD